MKCWKLFIVIIALAINISFATVLNIDSIVAIVNDDIILKSDVDNLLKYIKLNITDHIYFQCIKEDALRRHILEHLIIDQIILQIGKKTDIKITNEQINQVIANIAKQNNMTIKQMHQYLVYHDINYDTYRKYIYKDIFIAEVCDYEIRRLINILPQEIELLSQQINKNINSNIKLNLDQILIPLSSNLTYNQINEADDLAHSIIKQIYNDSHFFSKLKNNFYNHQINLQYNQIGWTYIKDLPTVIAQALITAKKGDIIGPVFSTSGFYIFKVNDLRDLHNNADVTELHVRHILIKTSPVMTDDQILKKLKQIYNDIKNGMITFVHAAQEFSDDINSANQGGDLGWITEKFYGLDFYNTLIHLKKGQLSTPIRSSLGWHLVEILDIRNKNQTHLVSQDTVYSILFNYKFLEAIKIWMQEQRSRSYVQILGN